MTYKIFIPRPYHHKNDEFLKYYSSFFKIVNNLEAADIIFSSDTPYPAENYPKKKFIFGPHFSVLPNLKALGLNNIHNNIIYLFPSKQAMNVWKNHFNFDKVPLVYCPFGVNTEKFKPKNCEKKEVFVYIKRRNPEEVNYVLNFLKSKKIKFNIFKYGSYKEEAYINQLKKAKYGIWVGEHESQGFALQEALSMNVPLLVWSTTLMSQEWGNNKYQDIKVRCETVPYWDEKCGEKFYEKEDFEKKFEIFIKKLNTYKPREFILENLSYEVCKKKFDNLLSI